MSALGAQPADQTGKQFDLVAVGDSSLDFVVRVPHIAGADNKSIGTFMGAFGGGMTANLAAAAARVGASCALVSKLGFEADARHMLEDLRGIGVDTSAVVVDRTRRTWTCFIQLDDTGEKALVGADTGTKLPELPEVDPAIFANTRMVAPLADNLSWAIEIAERAKAAGSEVAIDLEPDAFEIGMPEFERLLGLSTLVFANRDATSKIAPTPVEAAKYLLSRGPALVVVSQGSDGARAFTDTGQHLSARLVEEVEVVDTTGAGDALAGTFIARYLAGDSPTESLRAAVAASAECVRHLGSRTYIRDGFANGALHVSTTDHNAIDMEGSNANLNL